MIQWAIYLAKARDVHLTMRKAAARTGAACFFESPDLNGPAPGSSCAGACIQFPTGDPALPDTAMSGAIWAQCMVPPKPGDSSAAAELIMATMATKGVMAYRIQARELGHGPHPPTPLYLGVTEELHGAATEQVPREINYLAAKPTGPSCPPRRPSTNGGDARRSGHRGAVREAGAQVRPLARAQNALPGWRVRAILLTTPPIRQRRKHRPPTRVLPPAPRILHAI